MNIATRMSPRAPASASATRRPTTCFAVSEPLRREVSGMKRVSRKRKGGRRSMVRTGRLGWFCMAWSSGVGWGIQPRFDYFQQHLLLIWEGAQIAQALFLPVYRNI